MLFYYTNREEKAEYVSLKYKDFLKGKILDVGCSNKGLKKYLSKDVEYLGIDIDDNSDIFVNLEKQRIPFPDDTFDCVICLDVLEHLDNIHEAFKELIRVSKKYLIICLPNCYSTNLKQIIKGVSLKFYGLPVEKPKDRHKWFFNYDEAEEFIIKMAESNNAKIIEKHAIRSKKFIRNFVLKILLGEKYKNIVNLSLWVLIEKNRNYYK